MAAAVVADDLYILRNRQAHLPQSPHDLMSNGVGHAEQAVKVQLPVVEMRLQKINEILIWISVVQAFDLIGDTKIFTRCRKTVAALAGLMRNHGSDLQHRNVFAAEVSELMQGIRWPK